MTDVSRSLRRWPRLLLLIALTLTLHGLLLDWGRRHVIALQTPQETAISVQLHPVAPPAHAVALPAPPPPRQAEPAPPRRASSPPRPARPAPASIDPPDEPIRETVERIVTVAPEAPQSAPADANASAAGGNGSAAATAGPAATSDAPATDTPAAGRHYQTAAPPSAVLDYDVTGTKDQAPAYGTGRITWVNHGSSYEVMGRAKALFFTVLNFSSRGELDGWGVSPVIYTEQKGFKAATNTHFNRERDLVSFSASTTSYARRGGEQDRASLIWQLAAIGRGNPAQMQPGVMIDLFVAGVRDGEIWRMQVLGEEDITLPIGRLHAWHVVRMPKPGSYDDRVDIWLAPQHEWYPVRVRYTDQRPDGDYTELSLSGLTP